MSGSYTDLSLYRRLLGEARPYWPHITAIFLINLLATPLALLTPLPLKIAIDSLIGTEPLPRPLADLIETVGIASDFGRVVAVASLVVVIALLRHVQSLGSWLLQAYTGEKLVLEFRARLFRHVQRLSLAYHDTKGSASSTYRIQSDARAVQSVAISGVAPFVTASFTLAGTMYVTALIDWQLALVSLAISPILFLLIRASRRRLRSRWSEVKAIESSAMSVVQEVLGALRVVKAFGREDHEHRRFVRHSSRGIRGHVHLALIEGGFDLLIGLTTAVGTATVFLIGVLHVRSGAITVGDLLMVMTYLTQLYGPLETISKKVAQLQSSLASAERAFSLLDERPDVAERSNARTVVRATGAVAFQDVAFAYSDGSPILDGISFAIEPGVRVGIAGTTGAGKTTLVSLLTRFYDPTAGRILLDGVDLRDYKLADLRNQFAIVLQEPVLFSTSVTENIAYARPDATEAEIIEAAEAANAHEFIHRLPRGYETRVGERAMRLSGGERQRISLARAFLKDAPILILDEPTSSVDLKTEAAIVEAMERLMRARTTFMIAHRLSTLGVCDLLLVIENGRLAVELSEVPKSLREPRVPAHARLAFAIGGASAPVG